MGLVFLIVDDNRDMRTVVRHYIRHALGDTGIAFLESPTIEDALDQLFEHDGMIDAIICDHDTKSSMTGMDLLREIRKEHQVGTRFPFLLLSASIDADMEIELAGLHAVGVQKASTNDTERITAFVRGIANQRHAKAS